MSASSLEMALLPADSDADLTDLPSRCRHSSRSHTLAPDDRRQHRTWRGVAIQHHKGLATLSQQLSVSNALNVSVIVVVGGDGGEISQVQSK